MALVCALSGAIPDEPVVSKHGQLFEKSLIEKHLDTEQTCPVTKEPLTKDDLIALEVSKVVKVRPTTASSVPGLLALFQNEWDALMLETFTLKQHLETVRQELSHALYQHDAASRVIARLVKERDQARSQLASLGKKYDMKESDSMDVDSALPSTLPTDTVKEMTGMATKLSKGRKELCKRRLNAPALASNDTVSSYKATSSHNVHKSRPAPGINCVDVHASGSKVVTGGADNQAVVFSRDDGVVATLASHSDAVTATSFHQSSTSIFTASMDSTALLWTTSDETDYSVAHTYDTHTSGVTGLSVHPLGSYFATASLDGSWAVHDVAEGKAITQVKDTDGFGYGCVEFHPDGVILATGQDKVVKIWELKQCTNAFKFEDAGGVTDISFSQNGYYFATASKGGNLMVWDLRKLKKFQTLALDGAADCVSFDASGAYLAVGAGSSVSVYETKTWNALMQESTHTAAVTDLAFGPEAAYLCSTSTDQALKFFGV